MKTMASSPTLAVPVLHRPAVRSRGAAALSAAAAFWFLVTLAGQWMFAAYIAVLYGGSAARGDFARWNTLMTHGHVSGAPAGNAATALHLALAALVMSSGALQLLSWVRRRAPAFHRWNGRVYLGGAVVMGVTGIYMVWWRGAAGGIVQHLGTTSNGVLLVLCAGMTLQRVLAGDVAAHRRWALRLFLCMGGVWFFRIALMFWLVVNGGPAGFDPATFTGPFLDFLSFAQTLLPLAVLEGYLRCRAGSGGAQCVMALLLTGLTLAMGAGIGVATMGMWLPHM
jgi:hypothetical protein